MKLRKLVTAAVVCVFVFGATFGAYAMSMEKFAQGISAASYDSAELAGYAEQIAKLVNTERAAYGLDPVKLSPKLSEAANNRAKELKQSFSHTRPNGTSCFTAITELGITYRAAAENIAYGQKSPESVMKAWMNSSGHRANILNAGMEYIGVGAVYNNGVYYWSQFFAVSSDLSSGAYLPGGNSADPVPEIPEVTAVTEPELPPEPEVTAPSEIDPEPEVTTAPEVTPEPEATTAPEITPEPEATTAPEPETTTAPEATSKPETTTAPQAAPEPEKTEPTAETPCVTNCPPAVADPSNDCGTGDQGSSGCTTEAPCTTNCPPAVTSQSNDCNTGNQGSANCTTEAPCTTNCPPSASDPSNNCPNTGSQNSQNSNCFDWIMQLITNGCNSSSNNSSGNCANNNSCTNNNSCANNNSFVFGTQSSGSCPLNDLISSMFGGN